MLDIKKAALFEGVQKASSVLEVQEYATDLIRLIAEQAELKTVITIDPKAEELGIQHSVKNLFTRFNEMIQESQDESEKDFYRSFRTATIEEIGELIQFRYDVFEPLPNLLLLSFPIEPESPL